MTISVEELELAVERAEPLPWCWEQCGDKCDAPVVGVAFDSADNPIAGEIRLGPDDAEPVRWNIASDIGTGCDGRSASANAALIVAAVNALPELLSLAKLGLLVREGGEALADRLLETLQMMASRAMNLSLDDWSKHASAVQEAAALLSIQEMPNGR